MVTCSAYKPGQTLITSPGLAAATAALIVMYAGVVALQSVALAIPSSSTTSVLPVICMTGLGRTPVGVSVRSQPATRYAIAGKVRTATVLRSVCIGLLLEARRAVQPTGTALRCKAKHVPRAGASCCASRRLKRPDDNAFGKPSKWRRWREKPPLALRQGEGRCARTSEEIRRRESGAVARPWREHHGAATRVPAGDARRSGLPELCCGNAELLDLHVQGLVVHPQQPRRLALVAPCGSKRQVDRLPLRFRGRPASDLPQGEAQLFWWPLARSRHSADQSAQLADHRETDEGQDCRNCPAEMPYCFIF